jgi:hypothetical protein
LGFFKYPELAVIFLILKIKQLPHTQGPDSPNYIPQEYLW